MLSFFFFLKHRQQRAEQMRKSQGNPGQQKRVEKCKTIQCNVCKQTFMGSSTEGDLKIHAENKHPKLPFEQCFPHWEEQKAKLDEVLKK